MNPNIHVNKFHAEHYEIYLFVIRHLPIVLGGCNVEVNTLSFNDEFYSSGFRLNTEKKRRLNIYLRFNLSES